MPETTDMTNTEGEKIRRVLICAALAILTLAVFWQVRNYSFINHDDPLYVSANPNIQHGITLKSVVWAFTTGYATNWHPLTWLSHMLDWQLFGTNAGGHHLVNLFFHIANTLLLFIVLRQMTDALWQSAFVAALFAIHPLHVESVAWVSERKDVLSTFFWILTMWAYVRYTEEKPPVKPGAKYYLLMVVFFALGLMAKPMLVTLPFVLLLLDYWPLKRHFPGRLFMEKIPLFIIAFVSCIITFAVQEKGGATANNSAYLPYLLANAVISYEQYISKMLWPSRLAVFYPHPLGNVSFLHSLIVLVFIAAATIAVFRFAKDRRYLITGWLWYLGTLLPVIGIIQVGQQAMADRYTYIPLIGLFMIIAWEVPRQMAAWRYKKIILTFAGLLVIASLSLCAYGQVGYWQNNQTLFQHALDVTKGNYLAHLSLARSLYDKGKKDDAIYHLSEALRINPDYPDAVVALYSVLKEAGRKDDVQVVKNYGIALQRGNVAEIFTALGDILYRLSRTREAGEEYKAALKVRPNDPLILCRYAGTLADTGQLDEAIKYFRQALQINPNYAPAKNSLNHALAEKQP